MIIKLLDAERPLNKDSSMTAKNHNGYEVQLYTDDGWKAISKPMTRKEAETWLKSTVKTDSGEYRVYESLK